MSKATCRQFVWFIAINLDIYLFTERLSKTQMIAANANFILKYFYSIRIV